jgi:hypothetical protein
MKSMWLLFCTVFICYTSQDTEEVASITQIVCNLYDKEGIKAGSPDEAHAKKIGTYHLFPMATDEEILLQLYGQVPIYLQTQNALFSLPTRTERLKIENFAQKLFTELEKEWIIHQTDKKSFPSCTPPYHRPIYSLKRKNRSKS